MLSTRSPLSSFLHHVEEQEKIRGTRRDQKILDRSALKNMNVAIIYGRDIPDMDYKGDKGWEKAESEVAALRQHLEAGAECVRQLRQSREDQELKIQEALIKKSHEWKAEKSELESRLVERQTQLEAKNVLAIASFDHDIRVKLEALETNPRG